MIALIRKSAPYLLIVFCLGGLITGLGALFGPPPPPKPVTMSMREIQQTPPDKLPAWVQSDDGCLDWSEALTIYRKDKVTGKELDRECIIAPLVGKDGCKTASRSGTLMLVEFSWDDFKSKYPKVAAACDSGGDNAVEMSTYQVSFAPVKAETEYAFGIKNKALKQFEAMGFKSMVVVKPGGKPLTKSDGFGMVVMSFAGCLGGGFWIRSRRKARVLSYVDSLVRAGSAGMRQGGNTATNKAVASSVNSAFRQLRMQPEGVSGNRK